MYWRLLTAAALMCGVFTRGADAQVANLPADAPSAVAADPAAAAVPCDGCITIPALTPVKLELLATLSSKGSKTGEMFPLRLAEPIVIDGREIVPAGVTGMGEVVHAKKSGGSGVGGELVLAARYLDVAGQRMRLRSMRVIATGRSHIDTINIATAVSPLPAGVAGLFIKGRQTTIQQGSVADAKTAEAFLVALPAPASASPEVPSPPVQAEPVSQERGK